jgi:glycosyltransferase involved in cell wall biosynthesis
MSLFKAPYIVRAVSSYFPRICGIGTFARDQLRALQKHFTGETAALGVAAIDNEFGESAYHPPVDLVIDQKDPSSWERHTDLISARAYEKPNHPTVVIMQHEYGLDGDGTGTNYVKMTETLRSRGLTTLVQLHTVLENPSEHQKTVVQDLALKSSGLIVTAKRAVEILSSELYGISKERVKHIDHGIRMAKLSDREKAKAIYGLEKTFVIATPGLKSPDKGLEFAIEGFGNFVNSSLTQEQRKKMLYLVAGMYHPEFQRKESGRLYRDYEEKLEESLDGNNLRFKKVTDLTQMERADVEKNDVVFLERFLTDKELIDLYSIANGVLITPRNHQQISSGILSDTVGSGRVAIATKFTHALELLNENGEERGILVDLEGECRNVPNTEQIARALDCIVFNDKKREKIERSARARGHRMRWPNVAWELLQHIDYTLQDNERSQGRGVKFRREIPFPFEGNSQTELAANK